MNDTQAAAVAILVLAATIFVVPLIGITIGAFVGWIAGHFFPGTLGVIATMLSGGATMPAWQVGAVLGFVGSFFKTRVSAAK
jgi:hypothetical protein